MILLIKNGCLSQHLPLQELLKTQFFHHIKFDISYELSMIGLLKVELIKRILLDRVLRDRLYHLIALGATLVSFELEVEAI